MRCLADTGSPASLLPTALPYVERTLCDDHSRSTLWHSWDLLGKVVQLGVLEGSLYHKHEKIHHQLLLACSRWRLLRIPRGLCKFTNTTDLIPLLRLSFHHNRYVMNSFATLSFSMVALALHRTLCGRGATRHVCANMLPRPEMIPSTLGRQVTFSCFCAQPCWHCTTQPSYPSVACREIRTEARTQKNDVRSMMVLSLYSTHRMARPIKDSLVGTFVTVSRSLWEAAFVKGTNH